MYPNGDKAIFGFKNNYESQISYPITEYKDIDGNKITFDYFFEKNVYYIKSIQYGKSSNIKFDYKTGVLGSPIDYVVAKRAEQHAAKDALMKMAKKYVGIYWNPI